ncbi:winged helix-turn-helix transcriptional regulator [Natrialba sp. PRR66]|uniref:winged helix-turn-helix transcriptional regulator n=1 Tax=Natrialba sp. PRR66 TaxID=3098146 RepID=UPI002B1E033F|nr:winged helix-turn-helix transcriptional regulator [Natrialba sp. PRR66]
MKDEWLAIASELVLDPNVSTREIADRTDIPQSTVWYGINRMQEEGLFEVIAFLSLTQIDDLKVGLVGGAINGEKDAVLEQVVDHPKVWFLVDTIGPHAFTAGIVGESPQDFQSVIDELREFGAEGDHYGEVLDIRKFGIDREFVQSLRSDEQKAQDFS